MSVTMIALDYLLQPTPATYADVHEAANAEIPGEYEFVGVIVDQTFHTVELEWIAREYLQRVGYDTRYMPIQMHNDNYDLWAALAPDLN